MQSHTIVAGVNKSGTTSLYRYLSDHPEVCPSSVKETHFFHEWVTTDAQLTYENYQQYFDHCESGIRHAIEACPSYFTSGESVAHRIFQILPNVKLIVMLRDPVDRLYSYFKSALTYDNYATPLLTGYSFDEFVREALRASKLEEPGDERQVEFRRALNQGCHGSHVEVYGRVFPRDQIAYVFFEDFRISTESCVRNLCEFIGIDPTYFDGYQFSVENKTREYRSRKLQRLAYRMNMRFESILNRYPEGRKRLRTIYTRINERRRSGDSGVSEPTKDLLRSYYSQEIKKLEEYLKMVYPQMDLPEWVKTQGHA